MKRFDEHLVDGTVRRQSSDPARARALRAEAHASHAVLAAFLAAVPLSDANANHVIKNAYDIIMELVRAKMLEDGYNTTGAGAHSAEVAYLATLGLPGHRVEFADMLRHYRNGILYYGKSFDAAYAQKVLAFLEEVVVVTD